MAQDPSLNLVREKAKIEKEIAAIKKKAQKEERAHNDTELNSRLGFKKGDILENDNFQLAISEKVSPLYSDKGYFYFQINLTLDWFNTKTNYFPNILLFINLKLTF